MKTREDLQRMAEKAIDVCDCACGICRSVAIPELEEDFVAVRDDAIEAACVKISDLRRRLVEELNTDGSARVGSSPPSDPEYPEDSNPPAHNPVDQEIVGLWLSEAEDEVRALKGETK